MSAMDDPREIYDAATRNDVVRLHENFPAETLETCYFWYLYDDCHYETTLARFTNGLSNPFSAGYTPFPTINTQSKESANLGVFPGEIWQMIGPYLDFDDLSNLRSTSSALADIAAAFMVETIRFDLSFESLARLRFIATHEYLRISVKELIFETILLAPVGCIHSYSAHYELEHHMGTKPQPPPDEESSPQAQRLYARNQTKFEKEMEIKYAPYRKNFEAQDRILLGPKEPLFDCIDRFPNLRKVTLASDRCRHMLSERFIKRYAQDCAVPLIIDSAETVWELQNIVRPGIKVLHARHVSDKFFDGSLPRSKKWLQSIFRNLEDLCLHMRDDPDFARRVASTNLSYAISCAKNVRNLAITFATIDSAGSLFDILPKNHCFPNLRSLVVESMTATEEEVMTLLKAQPDLSHLDLSDMILSAGNWRSLLRRMRDELNLGTFNAGGVLEDPDIELYTEHNSVEAWKDGDELTLSNAIDLYVTDMEFLEAMDSEEDGDDEENECFNPVNRVESGDFESREDLIAQYGPIDDDDLEDFLANDVEAPDTRDDSQDESMHTANEEISANGDEVKDVEHISTDAEDTDDELPALMDVD